MPAVQPLRRLLPAVVAALLLAVLAAVPAAPARAQIFGADWVIERLESLLSGGGIEVDIGGLEGPLPGAFTLTDVTVSDPQGVFLRVPRARLDWKPLALARGRLTIEELTAEGVEVLRSPDLPETEEPPPEEGGGFDLGLLEKVRIDDLALRDLRLAEPVLGEEALLSVTGALGPVQDGDGIRADLLVERTDDRGGRAEVAATLAPGQDLSLDIQVAEPAGGVIARLLELPGLPPVRLTLDGSGPAARWSGELFATAEDVMTVEGPVTLGLPADGRWSAAVDLGVTTGPQAPAQWQALVRDGLALAVDAAGAADGSVTVSDLRAATDAYALTGEGLSLGPQGALDGRLSLATENAGALSALVALPFTAGTVTVSLDGTLQAPAALIDAAVRQLETGTGAIDTVETRVEVAADGPPQDPATPVTVVGMGTLTGLPEGIPGDSVEIALDATLDRAEQRLAVRMLQVDSAIAQARANLVANLDEMTAEGSAEVTAADLAPLAALAGLDVEGAGTLSLDFDRASVSGAVDGDLRLALSDLQWTNATYAALLGDHLTVTSDLQRSAAGAVQVENLTIDSGGVSGGITASLPPDMETIQADFALRVPEASALSPTLAGTVTLDGTVSGALTAPDVTVTAESPSLTAAGNTFAGVDLRLTAQGLDAAGAEGTIALSARGPDDAPLRLNAGWRAPGWQRIVLADLDATAAGLDLAGALDVALDPLALDGRLTGTVTDWGALGTLAGQTLEGQGGQVSVTLAPTPQGQTAAITAGADRLRLPAEEAVLRDVLLEAQVTDLLADPAVNATLTTGAGRAAGQAWDAARVTLDGGLGTGTVTARLDGPTDLTAEARYDLPAQQVTVTDLRVDDEATGLAAALAQPATLGFGGGGLSLQDVRLTLPGRGQVALDAALGPQRVALDLRLNDVPLSVAEPFVDGPLPTGTLQASVEIAGPPSNPTGTIRASIPDLAVPEAEVSGLSLALTGDLANERLDIRTVLGGLQAEEAVATASLPVRFSAQGIPSIPETAPIEALVRWRGEVREVWRLVPVVGQRLSGQGYVVAGVTGTLADPELTAEARITNGRYENLEWGTVLSDLRLEASRAAGGTVAVSLTGNDAGRGTLRMEARAELTDEGALVITADGGLSSATLIRRDDLRVTVSGDLGFEGPLDGGTFTADLTVNQGLFRLVNTLGGGITTLDVVEVGGDFGTEAEALAAAEAAAEAPSPIVFGLDVSVTIPNQFYVRGRGLESEWSGALRLTGTSDAPAMVGQLQVVRGQFDLIGTIFTFDEGLIEFSGGQRIDPGLLVVAVADTGDITAIIRVTGRASRPELELTARPPLPEDEVMARVLFGRGLNDLGAVEALQAANAVRILTGLGGGGPGITEVIAGTLGVDTIRLGGGEDGPALEIGKYITEDVYVGVEQGLAGGSGGVNVEVQLTPSISLEGKTTGRGSELGVNWQKDY